ncbi:MAG: peptidyl-prolyl cis-trans isomerase [Candidatus Omnitrophica bacterium]|nr:peptidyl-prolyl cis-trans isomerase [Candidatus Omnitrophota bacterium]MDD5653595.1 peptidyl-prolyl cis-trans isomerase [Candidatus Omnitrophota bacterium]
MKFGKYLFLSVTAIFIIAGCTKARQSQETAQPTLPKGAVIVAKVGNFYITADDLKKEIENYNSLVSAQGMAKNKIETRDKKISYLKDDIVRKYILYKEALSRGLDKKEDIARALQDTKVSLLVAALLRDETERIEVTSKEIEDFYNQNKDMLREPEQRNVFEIMTPTEEEAKQVYIELLKGTDFTSLAKQYSKASTAANGGEVGLISYEADPKKRVRFDKFYEVAFAPTLDSGGVSNIFKGPDGFYIVKVESIKKTEAKPLNELWDNIKNYLLFEKQQKAIAELANKLSGETKIEIYEGKIE